MVGKVTDFLTDKNDRFCYKACENNKLLKAKLLLRFQTAFKFNYPTSFELTTLLINHSKAFTLATVE
ncbi:hypothetical protein T07_14316 [Trichinella nelsoni]|uniref:Uncharacterized protein n=1 Tax=Trichinella nelsoni TaxID=6336 RepID=A0A0V0RZS7_9BILA|nr:hypothetical protein T07_14316 [Trichinella nelsoni]